MGILDLLKQRVRDRLAEGVTLNSFADECDIVQPILYRWLNGTRGLSGDTVERLAEHFGLTLCDETPKKGKK